MTNHLSSIEIVERYLSFFRQHNHIEISGSPLVMPGNSTSFIIAGMQPLLPYLRGQQTAPSPRLTTLQRCLRSDDIDAVGTNARKNSSFFMLGNWSLGDYGKHEAIDMALDLLLHTFELDSKTLWVTLQVETGCIVGFDETVNYDIQLVGGIRTMMFGGEGLFLATLTGPGRVLVQSMTLAKMRRELAPHPQSGGEEHRGLDALTNLFNSED